MELSVRPIRPNDFEDFINYWLNLSPAERDLLGVDPTRVPTADRMRSDLEAMVGTPEGQARSFVLAWCVDGKSIGHSSLKEILSGESGTMHLHIWRADLRGRGLGPRLFCLSVLDFYQRFKLKRIICEPKADNPAPNRVLVQVGFPLIGTRVGASSELSTVSKLNCYDIVREIAEDYLRLHEPDRLKRALENDQNAKDNG